MKRASRDETVAGASLNNMHRVRQLRSQLDAIPELRVERIRELRQAIRENRFVISAERIAEAMLTGE
jgi:flagellar biosynthesis anti-sigma factor FlgM